MNLVSRTCFRAPHRAATRRSVRLLSIALLCAASSTASAQLLSGLLANTGKTLTSTTQTVTSTTSTLLQTTGGTVQDTVSTVIPVTVTTDGNHAEISLGNTLLPLAEVSLDFEDATGLTPTSLGATASLVNPIAGDLLARLPDLGLTQVTGALPILLTLEPPSNGGLSFRGTGRMEIHTHLLPYSIGSSLRVFKAPLLGPFRDVTDEIAEGSVRARTTYGGFSQFLILVDLRPTSTVIDEKIGWLRTQVAALPDGERAPLDALLNQADASVDAANYAAAIQAVDAFRNRVQVRAGEFIPDQWRATRDVDNQAGQLIAGANTLRFSVAYLRDFGL